MIRDFASFLLGSMVAAKAMVGTNIGGWMVLEPWITPSLFYRFLGKTHSEGIGMDSYTVCEALGPVEGNKLMRAHWDTWFTEAHMQALAQRHVEIVRLPIGDWTTVAYGPYIGCMDGAAEKIDWFMDTAAKYGIKVLLDVHAIKDSQNGFDNSGKATNVEWTDETHFKHWSISAGNWMGNFNLQTYKYDSINWDNVTWAVNNCVAMMNRWGNHPAMYALEPVNEPWWNSDFSVLFDYYRQVRTAMKTINPNIIFVFHDAFNPWYDWNSLFADDDMENVIMDNHSYMAWWERKAYVGKYCDDYGAQIRGYAGHIKYPIWIGEWSLATDVCAFWLGGFNDSNTAY